MRVDAKLSRCRFSSTLLKQCRNIPQLLQLHGQSITNPAVLRLSPPLLLHTLTTLLAPSATRPKPSSCTLLLLHYALSIFSSIPNPTTFSYNTLIRAHTLLLPSPVLPSLRLFLRMRRLSLRPDSHSFPLLLKAASSSSSDNDSTLIRSLHAQALRFGFSSDLYVVNSLIRGYSLFRGGLGDARKVFDESRVRDVVSWNSMLDALVKSGELRVARELFDEMPERDPVTWATLISGYSRWDHCEEAVALFSAMMDAGVRPENVALVSALSACARLGAVEKGREVHDYIEKNGIRVDSFLSTGLVDFYAKCGLIDVATKLFESSRDRSLFTWNAILVGLAMHGRGELLLDYFARMVRAGVKPDGISFLGVLVGCSHGGLVGEARRLFGDMECVYGVPREAKHYGCMADLLARAGMIEEAMEMIKDIPMGGDVFVWSGLLGGCRIHGNVEVAERAAKQVMELKPQDGGVYSILANVYANNERWEDVVKIRRSLSGNREVTKRKGYSLIRLDGVVREFLAWDGSHPGMEDIFSVLNGIRTHQLELS